MGNMADRFAKLSAAEDDSLDAIADKQKLYEELVKGTPYLNARFWADTWCSAFVWKKDDTDLGRLCPTERKFREIERSPHSASPLIRDEIMNLAGQYQFHHWHLTFLMYLYCLKESRPRRMLQPGGNGGFDAVIGNPPWEKINLNAREWFATSRPDIANAKTAAIRSRLISELASNDNILFGRYKTDQRIANGTGHFLKVSERFPLSSRGDTNTYAVFADLNQQLISRQGRAGFIVPSGLHMTRQQNSFPRHGRTQMLSIRSTISTTERVFFLRCIEVIGSVL